ncbi:MAG: PD-(D/E)XK nuclease domain-containing protein, partial [Bacteroidales bacterium]|nr:PD-(D/E)XK nuclease domain-containing protein [Bacteroidales bacterium]
KYGEYWFETGTPTLLVDVMKKTTFDVTRIEEQETTAPVLSGVDSILDNPVPLFFQTGYLTVKDYDPSFGIYSLGFPNREVKNGFLNFLMKYYVPVTVNNEGMLIYRLCKSLMGGDAEGFMNLLDSLFSNTSYQIQGDVEKDFQYAMYIILELVGLDVEVERTTSNGRMDMLIKTKEYIYVIEIKVDSTADAALRQIEDKGYARPFTSDSRRLYEIGVSFSTATRRIEDWKVLDWAKIAD